MSFITAAGISVGILSGLWFATSVSLGLITVAGFLAWSSFFAAGGKLNGLKTTLILNFSGVVWGFLIVKLSGLLGPIVGNTTGMGIAVAIGSACMCWQSKISWLSFIPGAFIGCSTYFAAGFDFKGSVIGLVCGAILGYVSELGVFVLQKKEKTDTAAPLEN